MNQYLKNIQDILSQADHLSEEQKQRLLKAVAEADKQWNITDFKLDRTEKVKKTTAILLEETIAELELKRKAVEEQNRELEVEAALERVRAVAMGMKKPEDMLDVCRTIAQQLALLKVKEIRNVQTGIFYETDRTYTNYEYYAKHDKVFVTQVDYDNHPVAQTFANQMLKGANEVFIHSFTGKEVKDWLEHQRTTNVFIDPYLETADSLNYYWYSLGPVAMGISTYVPLKEEEINLFKRLRNVFELAYRRYLDIEKAEAQARETQIQLALERVRARTMAMQRSDELPETSYLLFQQFRGLGANAEQMSIGIISETDQIVEISATVHGNQLPQTIKVALNEPIVMKQVYSAWKENKRSLVIDLSGKQLKDYNDYRGKLVGIKFDAKDDVRWVINAAFFSKGFLSFSTHEPCGSGTIHLLERFAGVFDLTYTRFLDLKQAEAQARESQVQLALERVRARTMAMQKSEELKETTLVLFQQFKELGATTAQVSICIFDEEVKYGEMFLTLKGEKIDRSFKMELDKEIFVMQKIKQAFLNKEKTFSIAITGKELKKYNEWRNELIGEKKYDESAAALKQSWNVTAVMFSSGIIGISSDTASSEESLKLLERFAGVFDLTFTRFVDLQHAEAQTRESQIQLALERVRARASAMQKSDELLEVITVVSEQLQQLQIRFSNVSFLVKGEEKGSTFWLAAPGQPKPYLLRVPHIDNPIATVYDNAVKNGAEFFTDIISKEDNQEWLRHTIKHTVLNEASDDIKNYLLSREACNRSVTITKHIGLGVVNYAGISYTDEQNAIFKRFAKVFDQTYTRFLDLQKAEAQAREAQIEASLERVRSRAMAMQTSDELNALIGTVFTELTKLDLTLTRCVIIIYDPVTNDAHWWMANSEAPDAPVDFFVQYADLTFFNAYLQAWNERALKWVHILEGNSKVILDDFIFTETELSRLPPLVIQGMRAPERVYINASFNNFGNLTLASLAPLSDEHFDILLRFAKVFDLTYTRFNDLKQAEAQAREAKIEAALEKVRSRSLAMHKSDELSAIAKAMFEQLRTLGLELEDGLIIMLFKENSHDQLQWPVLEGVEMDRMFLVPYFDHPVMNEVYKARETGVKFIEKHFDKTIKDDFLKKIFSITDYRVIPVELQNKNFAGSGYHYSFAMERFTGILMHSYNRASYPAEYNDILRRFTRVFEQAYVRFLDLQKAEAQAKEAKIEAALERVRSRSLAMHKSDELQEVALTVFEKLKELDVDLYTTIIFIFEEGSKDVVWWLQNKANQQYARVRVPYVDIEYLKNIIVAKEQGIEFISRHYSFEEKNELFHYLFESTDFKYAPEQQKQFLLDSEFATMSTALMKNTGLSITSYSNKSFSEGDNDLLKRFGKVFDQAYTRFLDLQKAEAQAREAQIESSLEKVRAQALGMHKPADLLNICRVVFKELVTLGFNEIRNAIIHTFNDEQKFFMDYDYSDLLPGAVTKMPYGGNSIVENFISQIRRSENAFAEFAVQGKELEEWKQFRRTSGQSDDPRLETTSAVCYYIYSIGQASIGISTFGEIADEKKQLLKRFRNVFDFAYRRYIDVANAEAQSREAQIELSLERVRAKTMAMHNSEDVAATTITMFTELQKLGFENLRCGISIFNKDHTMEVWSISSMPDGTMVRGVGKLDMNAHPLWRDLDERWRNKEEFFVSVLEGKEKDDYIKILNRNGSYLSKPILEMPDLHVQGCYFSEGCVWTYSIQPATEEFKQVLKRFTGVFSLTFRRYQDLKKAEANAREATIEAALERVRGKAMAMHNSNDLSSAASMVFTELRKLGINPIRSGVGLLTKESRKAQLYSATSTPDGDSLSLVGWVMLSGHPVLQEIYDTWAKNEDCFPELQGEQLKSYYDKLLEGLTLPAIPDWQTGQKQYGHFLPFTVGCLYAWSETKYNEQEIKILKRFAAIIDLTFRRYLELQKSEANARDAVKQAALDRVRADIASMRTISDLDRITPLIWNELTILGIPFIRCGVFIMDDSLRLIHTFLSTPDGKAIAAFHIPYDATRNITDVVSHWRSKKNYINHWDEAAFTEFATVMAKHGALASPEQYLKTIPKGGFFLHFLPFLQGMLYVGNSTQLGEEAMTLIQHVADAFSTAYARYEDFNKLEAAKQQVDKTLVDLKQAQQQLVQSEKMASLGELTAGIAHEIQNPLNFVNNFSDVSNELLEEMKAELSKGNKEDAMAIADDVKQNLEKILHHGKRADAIVKGMLQHSRSSSGQKELTDINTLTDEYLRLAYHGLRAKDKSFNAIFETEFDNSISKVDIIPQEIGRVILNLINNAFYAVNQRQKGEGKKYKPTVIVSTKKTGDRVSIAVKDNGNGIPAKILDKIFQPFFTTKPTGQGTGLGLSLAYDIITKGHGGELKAETKEGEGSVFTILLPNHAS